MAGFEFTLSPPEAMERLRDAAVTVVEVCGALPALRARLEAKAAELGVHPRDAARLLGDVFSGMRLVAPEPPRPADPSFVVRPVPGAAPGPLAAGTRLRVVIPGCPPFQMAHLPPGSFEMGSPSHERVRRGDETLHHVTLTRPFALGEVPVTQELWEAVARTEPAAHRRLVSFRGRSHPAECGDWLEAVRWCNALSRMAGLAPAYRIVGREASWSRDADGFRLPTEAEWEYACRAGVPGMHRPRLDQTAWYSLNSDKRTHPVGQRQPNAWGLHDMLGNVWELCWDRYAPYPPGPAVDPNGPDTGSERVVRGGCWDDSAEYCRCASRYRSSGDPYSCTGLRVARDAPA